MDIGIRQLGIVLVAILVLSLGCDCVGSEADVEPIQKFENETLLELVVELTLKPEPTPELNISELGDMDLLKHCLALDKTNENEYVLYKYMCGHFTEDTILGCNRCFQKHGSDLYMYPVAAHIDGSRSGWYHICCAVEINSTWYFVEPGSDEIYTQYNFWGGYNRFFIAHWLDNYANGAKVRGVFKTVVG